MASPSKLGRYELREVLGKGAMGVVYEGFDPVLGRRVAIKTILPNAALGDDVVRDFAMRFTREAKAAARLSHPNIVGVYDFGVENDLSYLVMEFVQGTELGKFFESGELFDIQDATHLMTQLLDALELAHNAGIVHRDVKPANVMVDSEGHAKLADFGVARVSDGQDATQVGAMVGTPAYMSPEQVQGQPVDRRTDIFSAGVILYQFLTGQKPFQGGGAYTLARKIIHDDPIMPSTLVASVSPAYDRVIRRALAKSVDERYQTAREFSQALNALVGAGAVDAPGDDSTRKISAAEDDSTRKISAADLPGAAAAAPGDSVASGLELEFWRSIKDSQEIDEFELYLTKFPSGVYAELAQRKVARLQRASAAAAEEAATQNRQLEDQARARREAEEKAKVDAQAKEQALRAAQLKREAEAEAASRRAAASVREAAVAPPPVAAPASNTPPAKKSSMAVPAIIGVLAVAGAGAAYFVMQPKAPLEAVAPAVPSQPAQVTAPARPEPRQEAAQPAAPAPPAPAAEAQKAPEKAAREVAKVAPAPAAKAGADAVSKAAAGKAAADAAAAKAAADMEAAKSAAERAAAQAAAAAAAAEQRAAAAEQRAAAAEKAAADRAAADKAAADKASAEKAAAAKPAATASAAPSDAALAARRAQRAKELEWEFSGGRPRQFPRSTAEIEVILKEEGLVPGGSWKPPAAQAAPAAANAGGGRPDCSTVNARARNINC